MERSPERSIGPSGETEKCLLSISSIFCACYQLQLCRLNLDHCPGSARPFFRVHPSQSRKENTQYEWAGCSLTVLSAPAPTLQLISLFFCPPCSFPQTWQNSYFGESFGHSLTGSSVISSVFWYLAAGIFHEQDLWALAGMNEWGRRKLAHLRPHWAKSPPLPILQNSSSLCCQTRNLLHKLQMA